MVRDEPWTANRSSPNCGWRPVIERILAIVDSACRAGAGGRKELMVVDTPLVNGERA